MTPIFINMTEWSKLEALAGKSIISDCVTVRSGQKYALAGTNYRGGSEIIDIDFTATAAPQAARPIVEQRSKVPAPVTTKTAPRSSAVLAAVRAAAHAAAKTGSSTPAPAAPPVFHTATSPRQPRAALQVTRCPAVSALGRNIAAKFGVII